MYFACRRPQAATLVFRCGVTRSTFSCLEKRHGAPAVWLGAKGTYPICPMLRRRYLASLSLSRSRKGMITIGSGKGDAAGSTLYLE